MDEKVPWACRQWNEAAPDGNKERPGLNSGPFHFPTTSPHECLHPCILLRASSTPEILRGLSSRLKGGLGFFRCHCDGRLDLGQTASRSSSQYRRGRSLLIRELGNDQKIMVPEGQIPSDEFAS